jgi:hypothetical protein
MLVGVFTAIKVFNWVGTLYKGAIAFTAPFAYICGFLFFLVFGGMTGVALATVSLDVHWQDTYFVVAHFHFIMVGAVIMGFLAALHYWFPKMFGRKYPENWALLAAGLIVLGLQRHLHPQFLLGNAGMPRRYYEYPERFAALNVASTAGRLAPRLRVRHHRHLPGHRSEVRRGGGPEPVGQPRLRVGRAVAAPDRELRRGPRLHPGAPRVPGRPGGARQGGSCNLARRGR